MALIDRTDEFSVLSGLLEGARAGNSAALVLRGGPGIGKTALLETVSGSVDAHAMTTVRVAGIESEAPLGYAALHRLIGFFPGAVDRLPTSQRDALRTTFGLAFGPPPDRFLIGLSVLTLLADAAADGPLLAVIDDAQWLDPESGIALGFAARRLQAERVIMLFAARETEDGSPWLSALPELMIGPLDDRDATKLLSEVTSGLLGPAARARLLGECRGNPLALVEVARELTPEQLTGAAVLPDPLPAADSLRQLFARRLRQLTLGARLLLAVAAAEPTASGPLARSVAQRLGAAAEADGELDRLVSFGDRVRFSHPLVRSAAYYSTPVSERRRVHGALAEAMDSPQNSDRVAWHLAMSTTGPDEAIASRLEQVARRMRDRGGYAANSALLRRAAALSADEHSRTDRLLAAADAALTAGHPERARSMLAEARQRPVDERQAALALRVSGEALFATGATDDAARELLVAAKVLLPFDPSLARQTLLAALLAANFASAGAFEDVRSFAATIALADLPLDDPPSVADLFLLGFLRRLAGDAELAARLLRNALTQLERSERADELRAAIPAFVPIMAGAELIDESYAPVAASSYADFARRTGALTVLPNALISLARVYTREGRFEDADVALTEASQLRRATGAPGIPDISTEQQLFLQCWRGNEAEASVQAAALTAARKPASPGSDLVAAHLALLDLSKGRYLDAFERLRPITREDRLALGTLMLADFIEAAARSGRDAEAVTALDRLTARATAGDGRLGLGRLARSRALLAPDHEAEEQYRRSVEVFGTANSPTELARSHLVYGEWLRRQRRRREAREQLGAALDAFAGMGAQGFAGRAQAELEATGVHPTTRRPGAPSGLTAQETQVARLAAAGDTNREAAAKLFLSPATVDHHLRHIYQKLGVSSRTQLARKMSEAH